ncbi:glutathione S-transferase [Halomonas cupida]|uniref:glutathione S-transferase family protein n=1 Tax=Halomonas cupida TaxID=44933 RepID=UPI0039B4B488
MIRLHHLENSRSQRIVWLLEELEVDYDIEFHRRDPRTMLAPDTLKRLHPLGKSPLIVDEDAGGRVVAESGAIIEYLLERHDGDFRLSPDPGHEDRQDYLFWLHHAEASAMPPLVMSLVFSRLGKSPVPWWLRPLGRRFAAGVRQRYLGPEISRLRQFWEDSLADRQWFSGNAFSAADIQMSFPLMALASRAGLEGCPRLEDFLQRVRDRDAYRRTLEKVGDLTL